VKGSYSYEEVDYAELATQTQKNDVGINEEVQASQDDQEVLTMPEQPASAASKGDPIDSQKQFKKVVKLDHTSLVDKDEVRDMNDLYENNMFWLKCMYIRRRSTQL
jgi:hypothetical protein